LLDYERQQELLNAAKGHTGKAITSRIWGSTDHQFRSMPTRKTDTSRIGIKLVLPIVLSTPVLKSFVSFSTLLTLGLANSVAEVDSFIAAHGAAMDICQHPSVRHHHTY
jgi:hypothetical protein